MTYRWLDDLDVALGNAGIDYVPVGASSLDPTGAPDWRTRGRPATAGDFNPVGVLCHHTASPAGTSDQGDLNVILAGNSEAPGPISQLYIGRGGTVYLVAAGRANHGGSGAFPGDPCGDMNAALVGIEAGNSGVGERWPDDQTAVYANVVAALVDHYGWGTDTVYLHATVGPVCANHKIDPAGPWELQPDLPGGGAGTWDLFGVWRPYVETFRGRAPHPGGDELVHTLIRVEASYVVLAGDMDAQGVVHDVRWVGPELNKLIGFQPDNVTPVIPGTSVLNRKQSDLWTMTLLGPVPAGDLLTWSPANFYTGQ
jgi:hypothetical protein